MTNSRIITTCQFARATDDQIVEAARSLISQLPHPAPALRRLVRARHPDVQVAGKFLWAQLTKGGRP